MDETILTWNVANWITVVLMVMLGFAAFSVIAGFVKRKQGGSSE